MKMVNLLNEARFRWKYKELPKFRQEPESVTGYRIVRRERGEDANVTLDDMMKILRNEEFVSNFKNKSYVFWVELKTTRARKKVAFVHIFNVNNLPDYILPDIQTPYTTIDGAKIFIKDPKKDVQRGKEEDEVETFNIGDKKRINGKLYIWDGKKWTLKTTTDPKTTTTTTKTVPPGTPLLKLGSRGESVKQLQTLLGLTGDSVDGIFGSETTAWLTVWQDEHDLSPDGIYGPKSAAAMKNDPSPVKDTAKAKRLTINLRDSFKRAKQTKDLTPVIKALDKEVELSNLKFSAPESTNVAGMSRDDIERRLSIDQTQIDWSKIPLPNFMK